MIYLKHPSTGERAILSIDDEWTHILSLFEQGYRARSPVSNEVLANYAQRSRLLTTPTTRH